MMQDETKAPLENLQRQRSSSRYDDYDYDERRPSRRSDKSRRPSRNIRSSKSVGDKWVGRGKNHYNNLKDQTKKYMGRLYEFAEDPNNKWFVGFAFIISGIFLACAGNYLMSAAFCLLITACFSIGLQLLVYICIDSTNSKRADEFDNKTIRWVIVILCTLVGLVVGYFCAK